MIKTVIKRDGRQVPFNLAKIATAILKALAQTRDSEQLRGKDDFELEALANKLAEDATRRVTIEAPDIEKIQDAVERPLMEGADRSRARERNTTLMKTPADIVFSSAKESDVKRENANIDGDTAMGSMLKFGSESSKRFYIDNMLRPDIARAHEQGDIHIHDLDFYSLTMTCCQIDLVDLLSRGFSTGHGFLRAPKEIRSFAALACIAIQSNQNDQHGGQSVPNFDLAMAMGVRLTYARRYKAALREAIELLCNPETAADIILPGIKEGEILCGETTAEKIAAYYLERGAQTVVVKTGAKGAYGASKTESFQEPTFRAEKIVDTVGAGDGFAAGTISALAEGLSLRESVRRGNAIGTLQIMSPGDNTGLPTREQLAYFMETTPQEE